jgi:hypothetical protein
MSNKYTRVLDINLTANDGWYDFMVNVVEQAQFQLGYIEGAGKELLNLTSGVYSGPGRLSRMPLEGHALPQKGVVIYALKAEEIHDLGNAYSEVNYWNKYPEKRGERFPGMAQVKMKKGTKNKDLLRLVRWVNDDQNIGKIRIHAHGDADGYMTMWPQFPPVEYNSRIGEYEVPDYILVSDLARCLLGHGLGESRSDWQGEAAVCRKTSGVTAITMMCCYSGEFNPQEPTSLVEKMSGELAEDGLVGIKVTGCSQSVLVLTAETIERSKWESWSCERCIRELRELLQKYGQRWPDEMKEEINTADKLDVEELRLSVYDCWRILKMEPPVIRGEGG